jgi:transcription initiation factor TFIIIB Brf1 subunit/transcription initiation factor TFIIB
LEKHKKPSQPTSIENTGATQMSIESRPLEHSKVRRCPECGSDEFMLDYEGNQMICKSCGFALTYEPGSSEDCSKMFEKKREIKLNFLGARPLDMMSLEGLIRELQDFTVNKGRLPKANEPEIEKVIELAAREFGSLDNALRIAGLLPEEPSRMDDSSLAAAMKRILDMKPMTLPELRSEIEKIPKYANCCRSIPRILRTSYDFKSVGPRRRKVYYLCGQESLALSRIGTILDSYQPEVYGLDKEKADALQGKILEYLSVPKTRFELEERFLKDDNFYSVTTLQNVLTNLLIDQSVAKVKFVRKSHGSHKYSAYDLFGRLAGKTYYYRMDRPQTILHLLAESISPSRMEDRGYRSALTFHLKRIFPRDISKHLTSEDLLDLVYRVLDVKAEGSVPRIEKVQGVSVENLTRHDLAQNKDEVYLNCYCYALRKDVKISGKYLKGTSLLCVESCDEQVCDERSSMGCLIGKTRVGKYC